MATPRTPRKRAAKEKRDTEGTAPEAAIDTSSSEANPFAGSTKEAKAQDDPMILKGAEKSDDPTSAAKEADAPAENPAVEDAVVLDEPKPEPEAEEPKAAPEPKKPEPKTSEPAAIAAAPTVVKSGPGFFPLVLGGVVAAGLGFGLARYVVPEGWPVPGSTPLQAQLTQQADEIKALRADLQALPQDDGSAVLAELGTVRTTADTALETANSARTAAEEALAAAATLPATGAPAEDATARISALEERLTALEQRPAAASGADPAILSQLSADIDSLRSGLEAQKAAAVTQVQAAETARVETETKAQTVLLQAALTKVEAAMQNGAPYGEPLTLLADAGVAVPAVLSDNAEGGLPTIAALTDAFADPARAALEASLRGNMGNSWSERVSSFLRSQTGARSLTPQEGDDPDAILSRANAAVASGDLQTAMTEIATLPEEAQAALAAWVEQAKLRLDAQTATVDLATALSER
jgi:hypothetical protein